MKNCLFLILIFSSDLFACLNEIPVSEAQKVIDGTIVGSVKTCSQVPADQCLCFDNINFKHVDIVDEMVNDTNNPVLTKTEIEACISEPNCIAKRDLKTCAVLTDDVIMAVDFSEVYCQGVQSYPQIPSGLKVFKENATKKANDLSLVAAESTKRAAMYAARKARKCGETVIDALLVQNYSKTLTTAQIKAINVTYAAIKDLLETGSLNSAREEINAVVADGVLVTDADKIALVAQLDSCKP